MDVKFDFSDVNGFFRQGYAEVKAVEDDGLVIRNDAEYASHVESKGYEVSTGAALYAEKRLKEEIK